MKTVGQVAALRERPGFTGHSPISIVYMCLREIGREDLFAYAGDMRQSAETGELIWTAEKIAFTTVEGDRVTVDRRDGKLTFRPPARLPSGA